jgi:hypothetical protein
MLALQNAKKAVFFLFLLICTPLCMYGGTHAQSFGYADAHAEVKESAKRGKKYKNLSYYLYISDFINSFIDIPTSTISDDSTTISSTYLAGRAPLYNRRNEKVGTCSASFLCMQNADGIFTDISNYLSVDNGLIVTWFTPTTLINLELDSILHSMVTECIVVASTKVGFNPFYGKTFNMIVSSDDEKIYFKLSKT